MNSFLDIITVTKDNITDISLTVESTRAIRDSQTVKQIVIDSSDDENRKKVESLVRTEKKIKYKWQTPSGIAAAFNMGINESNAEWVWFLNASDMAHPNISADKLLYIIENSHADIIIFRMEYLQSGKLFEKPPLWKMWPPLYNWIPHPATIIRRKVFDRYGLFDESFSITMDYEFWLRVLSQNVIVDTISIPIALFDQRGLSSKRSRRFYIEAVYSIKMHFPRLLTIAVTNILYIFKAFWFFFRRQ